MVLILYKVGFLIPFLENEIFVFQRMSKTLKKLKKRIAGFFYKQRGYKFPREGVLLISPKKHFAILQFVSVPVPYSIALKRYRQNFMHISEQ